MPSLNDEEITALADVQDAGDVPDATFAVMADHIKRLNLTENNEPIRLRLSVSTLLATPSATRGELYRIEGQFLDRRRMPPPHSDIDEWFLRLPSGEPVAVYLPSDHAKGLEADGRPISIDARFYKVIEANARDGQVRQYPAFFGRSPRMLAETRAAAMERMDILVLLGFLILLVIVAFAVMALARKQRRPRPQLERSPVEPQGNMSDDPAVALRELRSQGERSHS
ncbi:MAG: hypothetical protein VX527_11825 [Planctomycetota bacterium]|nr:hypothetical protein [Planctomycetota bacterium]